MALSNETVIIRGSRVEALTRATRAIEGLPLIAKPVVDVRAGTVTGEVFGSWKTFGLVVTASVSDDPGGQRVLVAARTRLIRQVADYGATKSCVREVGRLLERSAPSPARAGASGLQTVLLRWYFLVYFAIGFVGFATIEGLGMGDVWVIAFGAIYLLGLPVGGPLIERRLRHG